MILKKKTPLVGCNLTKSERVLLSGDGENLTQFRDTAKRFSTLQAEFAIAGHELRRSTDGEFYYVHRWGLVRTFKSLPEVAEFLERQGVKP